MSSTHHAVRSAPTGAIAGLDAWLLSSPFTFGFLSGLDVCSPIGSLYLLSDLIIIAYLCFWLLFLDVVVLPPRFSFESIPRGVVRVRRSVVGLMPVHDLLRDLSD